MRKIGLILDSACGLTITEANEKGHGFIPLQVSINDKVGRAGVDIMLDELHDNMQDKKSVTIKTSLPNGVDIEKAFDWALERYEKAIYIGISHKMSGTQNAAKTVVIANEKYKDKIYVYDSLYSSPWLNLYIDEFERLLEQEDDFEKLKEILDTTVDYQYGNISPGDIYWFYKGGRISKSAYMAGSLLKVSPILTIDKGNLDKDNVIKARGMDKAIAKASEMVKAKAVELKNKGIKYKLICMDSNIKKYTIDMIERMSEDFAVSKREVTPVPVSIEQTAHMGPGSSGAGIFVSLFELNKDLK